MKAIISVTGRDGVGIVQAVSEVCTQYNVNISDISQTVMQEYFAMIMMVNIDEIRGTLSEFSDALHHMGAQKNLDIHVMHEDIFNAMHRV